MKIGIVGFGNMGEALGRQFLKKNSNIFIYDKDIKKLRNIKGFYICPSAKELIENSDTVIIAVKPQDIKELLINNKEYFLSAKPLLVSIAAGIPTQLFENYLKGIKIIRVMPNLAVTVGESATFICKGSKAKHVDLGIVKDLFSLAGVVFVTEEAFLNKVTSITGSGPGYIYHFMDSMYKKSLSMGFKKNTAKTMVIQTFLGAVKAAVHSDKEFDELVNNVASKGGTTEAALKVFRENNFEGIIDRAIESAYRRAEEIASAYL